MPKRLSRCTTVTVIEGQDVRIDTKQIPQIDRDRACRIFHDQVLKFLERPGEREKFEQFRVHKDELSIADIRAGKVKP